MQWMVKFFYFSKREINGMKVLLGLMGLGLLFPLLVQMTQIKKMVIPESARLEIRGFLDDVEKTLAVADLTLEEVGKTRNVNVQMQPMGSGKFETERAFQSQRRVPVIEINGADSLILQVLPGIGPAFASRIVRFRERLGGFCEKEQLMEVYGLDSVRYQKLKDYVRVDTSLVRRIRINEVDAERLGRHPLVGYKLGNLIVRYRDHHGKFRNETDLKSLGVLDEEIIKKLKHYLVF